jgi:hypothetical protein
MLALAISVLWGLIGLCILVGILWVVVWVLNQLGIIIPPMAIKIGCIIIGLLCLIWLLTSLAGGGWSLPEMGTTTNHRLSELSWQPVNQMPTTCVTITNDKITPCGGGGGGGGGD